MVKIKWPIVFQAMSFLLHHSDVIAAPTVIGDPSPTVLDIPIAVPIFLSTTPASASISAEVSHDTNRLTSRHRKLLGEGMQELDTTILSPPPTQIIDRRYPNEAEHQGIEHALLNYAAGESYRVYPNGRMTTRPKDDCDPTFCCGKMEFHGTDGKLLYKTCCCHCNRSCLGYKAAYNSAEWLLGCFVTCTSKALFWECCCRKKSKK